MTKLLNCHKPSFGADASHYFIGSLRLHLQLLYKVSADLSRSLKLRNFSVYGGLPLANRASCRITSFLLMNCELALDAFTAGPTRSGSGRPGRQRRL